jgi:hypothetical protein
VAAELLGKASFRSGLAHKTILDKRLTLLNENVI